MKRPVMASIFALAMSEISRNAWNFDFVQSNQIPPPNTKNDNAAARNRQAKKNRNMKRRGKK